MHSLQDNQGDDDATLIFMLGILFGNVNDKWRGGTCACGVIF